MQTPADGSRGLRAQRALLSLGSYGFIFLKIALEIRKGEQLPIEAAQPPLVANSSKSRLNAVHRDTPDWPWMNRLRSVASRANKFF